MKIGLHIADFTFPDGPAGLRDDLTRVATTAEEAGFDKVSVMDHLWQISFLGPPEHEMLEAYTTLGYLAARTSKVELISWVTAVVYREPGMLAKLVTTLDVLSGGRAWLGIGAAWNDEEATASVCRSRRPPNGSSDWRRRCRSACRCGQATKAPTTAGTTNSAGH